MLPPAERRTDRSHDALLCVIEVERHNSQTMPGSRLLSSVLRQHRRLSLQCTTPVSWQGCADKGICLVGKISVGIVSFENTQLGLEVLCYFGYFKSKIETAESTNNLIGQKFAASCRKIATSCPPQLFNLRLFWPADSIATRNV